MAWAYSLIAYYTAGVLAIDINSKLHLVAESSLVFRELCLYIKHDID